MLPKGPHLLRPNLKKRKASSSSGTKSGQESKSKWKSSNKDTSKPKEKDSKKPKNAKEQKQSKNSKGKCFHCDGEGHWRRNCPAYLAELAEKKKNGMTDLHVLEAFYAEDTSSTWIVDSGATNHVCSSLQLLSS